MNLANYLAQAEVGANYLIRIKDQTLGAFFGLLIPTPTRRKFIRQTVVRFFAFLSRPLSQAVDRGIENDTISVPNLFSISRAIIAPLFIIFVHLDAGKEYLLMLIGWAIFSDFSDGVLAKKMGQETELGGLLDAGCDKILYISGLIAFQAHILLWPVNAAFSILLESILATLALLVWRGEKNDTPTRVAEKKSNWLGKTKYCLQGAAGLCYIYALPIEGNWFLLTANFFAAGSIIRHLVPQKK